MQLGMIGLGRMGGNMVRRLLARGHACVVHDRSPDAVATLAREGAVGAGSQQALVSALDPPRHVCLMVPAAVVDDAIAALAPLLEPGDAIIDGGNSHYHDDIARAARLKERGLHYVDMGTSGGVWGLERGYCLMIGGEREIVARLDPVFRALAPGAGDIPPTAGRESKGGTAELGYLHCGPSGAGHFVKMIHNGIEYGMMQAIAEGFDILKNAGSQRLPPELRLAVDVADVAEVWRRGSVITSWLLDLTAQALASDPALEAYAGQVSDSGEGRWTVEAANEAGVPAHVLTAALFERFASRGQDLFQNKVLSAMRKGFGGHVEKR